MTDETCKTCRFFVAGGSQSFGGNICRRYPESTRKDGEQWCGEYQPRKVAFDETERRFFPAPDEGPGVTAGAPGVVQVCPICDIEGCKHMRRQAVPAPTAQDAAQLFIRPRGQWIAKISPDGIVTFNPDLRPDGAGGAAWDALMAAARAHNCGGISGGGDE